MIRSLIASLALSTLCIPQVHAADTYTHQDLLNQFKDLGGRVYIDSEVCARYPTAFGIQSGISIHLCTEPHQGDVAEMQDTIRHEVWHIVQACHGGPISVNPAEAISEAYGKGWDARSYRPDAWHMEAEAYYVAATRSAEEISTALIKICS